MPPFFHVFNYLLNKLLRESSIIELVGFGQHKRGNRML
jgi:hypothetical protein